MSAKKKFTFYWRDGKREVLEGKNPAEAATLRGYSNGAMRALDFYANGDDKHYTWNEQERRWVNNNMSLA